ncbi:MAG: hypothetical protein FWD13_00430 [Treponema sp.]|nr:hypothetical protein [Treponema sp.]
MIFLGILFALAIMGAVSYFAIDKKSSFHTRLVSIIALGIMILTVIICIIIALSDTTVAVDMSTLIVNETKEEKEETNIIALIFSVLFFIALFVVIAYLAMKEHKKSKKANSD